MKDKSTSRQYTYSETGICSYDNCNRPHHSRGWCGSHYNQWARTGTTWKVKSRTDGSCVVSGCAGLHVGLGYCGLHYSRYKRVGNPHDVRRHKEVEVVEGMKIRSHPMYVIWDGMRQRCKNPNNSSWENYGGRGVKVCERWDNSFKSFLDDMGERPSITHSIDRIDINGNYEPGNVRWATRTEQALNRGLNKNNTTGVKGVYRSNSRWSAEIWSEYRKIYIGTYDTIEEALSARLMAESIYHNP